MAQLTTIYALPLEIVELIATINKNSTLFSSLALAYQPFGSYTLHHQAKYLSHFLTHEKKNKWLMIWTKENNIRKVKILLKCGADIHVEYKFGIKDGPLVIAARNGHMDIVQLLIDRGSNDYYTAMINAARGGHIHIVQLIAQLMLDKGVKNFDKVIIMASRCGHMNTVKLILDLIVNVLQYQPLISLSGLNRGMAAAAIYGHMDIVQLLLVKGAKDHNRSLALAARHGHMDIVQLMLDKGVGGQRPQPLDPEGVPRANDYNRAMVYAAEGGHKEIVQLMLDKGVGNQRPQPLDPEGVFRATGYNGSIESATLYGHMDIVQLIQSYQERSNG